MKKIFLFCIISILLILGGFFILRLSFKKDVQKGKNIAQATPPPTQPLARINKEKNLDKKKKLSFPAFNILLQVPIDLKTNKEVDPTSEDTQVGSNFMAFYTSDSVIDKKTHTQTAGAKLSIKLLKTKKGLSDKKDSIPTQSIHKTIEDDSIIPSDNSLLNKDNTKVYVFPLAQSSKVSAYNVEVLVKNNGDMVNLTVLCADYSYNKDISTCQNLLMKILPTIQYFNH